MVACRTDDLYLRHPPKILVFEDAAVVDELANLLILAEAGRDPDANQVDAQVPYPLLGRIASAFSYAVGLRRLAWLQSSVGTLIACARGEDGSCRFGLIRAPPTSLLHWNRYNRLTRDISMRDGLPHTTRHERARCCSNRGFADD